jgi:hypothetical protein
MRYSVRRADVSKWLGEPDATRKGGDLAVYIEPREISRNLNASPSRVDYHYLLIEYDESDKVANFRKLINATCALAGIAVGQSYRGLPRHGWFALQVCHCL